MSTFDDVQEPVQREEEETSLTGIDFSGQKLGALDFAGKTLTDCNFSGCDLEGSDFTGASVTRCDMSLAQLSDCVFDEAHLTEVTLAKAKLSFASFVRSHLSHVSLAFASLEQALLQACVFEDVSWPSVSLVQATLLELSHLPSFLEADLTQTQCLGCDLTGLEMSRSSGSELFLQNCAGCGMLWQESTLPQCVACNGDFSGSRFLNCNLSQAGFSASPIVILQDLILPLPSSMKPISRLRILRVCVLSWPICTGLWPMGQIFVPATSVWLISHILRLTMPVLTGQIFILPISTLWIDRAPHLPLPIFQLFVVQIPQGLKPNSSAFHKVSNA